MTGWDHHEPFGSGLVRPRLDLKLKKLATRSGLKQYLAFDELARRIRDNQSSWSPEEGPWAWDHHPVHSAWRVRRTALAHARDVCKT